MRNIGRNRRARRYNDCCVSRERYFWVQAAVLDSGIYGVSAPTFSITSGYYISNLFPLLVTISHELAANKRSIYYTTDGTTPTILSILYNEVHMHIPAFTSGDPVGTTKTIKAVAYVAPTYGTVATLTVQKMGNFVYGTREVWLYDVPVMNAAIISSGAYTPTTINLETLIDPTIVVNSAIVDSGVYWTPLVVSEDLDEDPTVVFNSAILDSGRYWDPVVNP